MITWGISANSHNAAVAVFCDDQLVFASETERWSKIKNDPHLNHQLIKHLLDLNLVPDEIVWYERPLLKTIRQFTAGQGWLWSENNVKKYLKQYIPNAPIHYIQHHHSHAAGGYYTSGFKDACVVVIDAIGEFETLTIWKGEGGKLTKLYSQQYPHSIGLWYSAMTQRIGLKPNEEEYILMGMAAYGESTLVDEISNDFIKGYEDFTFSRNLHQGCMDWRPSLGSDCNFDIAAGTQTVYERIFHSVLEHARVLVPSKNLVLMGGCALNCSANPIVYEYFKNLWIMPAPGDSGSAIGSVLAHRGKHIKWPGPYLGYDMKSRNSNKSIVTHLLEQQMCGVARGPAEFGPRALGNRSLLADPRGVDIKDKINAIKHREQFRPFAPAILEEHVSDYFDIPCDQSPYMQLIGKCKHPDQFPAIVHADSTSRIQTVSKENNPEFYELLNMWYEATGCPMLLNTSLNVKGHPMVNDADDARLWESTYGVKVFN